MRPMHRLAVAGTVVLATLSVAAPAFAHVEAEGDVDAGNLVVTFSFSHGCSGSDTTSLRVQLPDGATVVATDQPTGWSTSGTTGELTWTGGVVPDGEKGTFVATMSLTGSAGETIFFPTIQGCTTGENDWIDKSDDPEAENAAPRVTLTESLTGGGTTGSTTPATTPATSKPATTSTAAAPATTKGPTATTAPTTVAPASSDSSSPIGIILGVIAAVIVVGAAVLVGTRMRKGGDGASAAPETPATDAGGTGDGDGESS